MLNRLIYGNHKKYGDWLEKIFRAIHGDSREVNTSYQKTQVAKEAAEDREYIEQHAAQWFILALYGFYFFKVLQRKDFAEVEGGDEDGKLIEQRTGTFFKAMNVGFGGDDTATKICLSIIQRWDAGGLTPEYITAENLASHFNFAIGSGRDEVAFKEGNTRFFQTVRDQRIIPALYEFLGKDDPDVERVLDITSEGYDGFADSNDATLPDWLRKGNKL